MRVLFVVSTPNISEPMGAMLLAACCKGRGHEVDLSVLEHEDPCRRVDEWRPDVVAYSAMSADIEKFQAADARLREHPGGRTRGVFRIMGGPHPTYYPRVLEEMGLDAICQGDGENALLSLLERLENGGGLSDIPNIGTTGLGTRRKELVSDLDGVPFADRRLYYERVAHYRHSGFRSFYASRGCPYKCTYCFNHAYNSLFRGCGPILRRRSVENLIAEIEEVRSRYPPLRMVRFGDDTFAFRADPWLEDFAENYRRRVGVPFYCLMRANTLTEDTARLLAEAGCRAVSMSIEAGDERVRNQILQRNLSDEQMLAAFTVAHKHGLRTYSNTILGIPRTSLSDDECSLNFARRLRPTVATFTICCPYPGTELWEMAVKDGTLPPDAPMGQNYMDLSPLSSSSRREKEVQARMCYFGTLYCRAPHFLLPFLRRLFRSSVSLKVCNLVGLAYMQYRLATRIFPWGLPRSPRDLLAAVLESIAAWKPRHHSNRLHGSRVRE